MKNVEIIEKLKELLKKEENIKLCILFGSMAAGQETFNSDIDVAVSAPKGLNIEQKQQLIKKIALVFERPVDLIDLQATSGTLLHHILTKGNVVFCDDHHLYTEIIKKMLYNQADFMPYHHRILKERRERWINE